MGTFFLTFILVTRYKIRSEYGPIIVAFRFCLGICWYMCFSLFLSYGSPLRRWITFWNYQIYVSDCLVLLFLPLFFGKRSGFGLRFLTQFILAWLFYVFFPTIYSLSSCSIINCTLFMLKKIWFHFFSVTNINSGYDLQKWKKRCFFRFKTAYQSLTMTCRMKKAESILHLFKSPEGQESSCWKQFCLGYFSEIWCHVWLWKARCWSF